MATSGRLSRVAQGFGFVCTTLLVLIAAYLAAAVTFVHGDVAWSAFFGVRAPVEIGLAIRSVIFAAVPLAAGVLAWRAARPRPDPPPPMLLALGTPGTISFRLRATAVVILVFAVLELFFTLPLF